MSEVLKLVFILVVAAIIITAWLIGEHRSERRPAPRHRRQYDGSAPLEPGWRPGLADGEPFPRGPERDR